jgi:ABC-2 type transport system permease protein
MRRWLLSVMAMELRKILAYRSDFWVTFLGQVLIQIFIAHALWQAVFAANETEVMQGFTLSKITLYYVVVAVGGRILTGENIGFVSREIYEGTFSRYLIYPLSAFHYKATTYLTYSLFYSTQLILIYFIYRLGFTSEMPNLTDILNLFLGTALFLLSALVYVLMVMMVELLALWADNIWSLVVMLRFFSTFLGGGLLPLTFFPTWAQEVLGYFPFPYYLSLPARTILGETNFVEIGIGIGVLAFWGLFFAGCVTLIWKVGQKHYTGVGV